jgi:site-specific DNA-methyltransferase (adenine-specific)
LAEDGSWFVNIKEHCDDGQRSLYVKDLTLTHVRQWGWRFVDELCWLRSGVPGFFPNRFKNGFEPVFHFSTGQCALVFNPAAVGHLSEEAFKGSGGSFIKDYGCDVSTKNFAGIALPNNVIDIKHSSTISDHTAAFPVGLPSFFIKAYSDPSDAIFDPFLGSGTTLIAAAKEGRVCYGVEISPGYCDIIRRRWTAYANQAGLDAGEGALE